MWSFLEVEKEAQDTYQLLQTEDPQGSRCSNMCWKPTYGGGELIFLFLGEREILIF